MNTTEKSGAIGRFFRASFLVVTGYFALVGLGVTILGGLVAVLLYKQLQGDDAVLTTGTTDVAKQQIERAVLRIKLDRTLTSESLGERQKIWGALFSDSIPLSLDELQLALRRAVGDERIHAVLVEVDNGSGSLSTLTSLRRSLATFAASKKPIYFHLNEADSGLYYLASVGNQVSLSPIGGLNIPGPAFQLTYFGSALERLGVQLEVVRAGKYKSAMESFVQDQPSPETLEMYKALEGSLRDTLVAGIAEGRKRTPEDVRSWLKRSFFTSKQAKEQGLIDRVGYLSDWEAAIKTESKALQFVELEDYLETSGSLDRGSLSKDGSSIALIEATGEIVSSVGGARGEGIAPGPMIDELRWAAEDKSIKAVVLRVDSPGGSALASDVIWEEVRKLGEKKPLVVSMGSVAASGGYYISAPAQLIFAEPTTITGSIGVIGAIPKGLKLADKWGVNFHMITGSDRRDYLNFGAKSSADDKSILGESIKDTYDTFVQKVAAGRKQDPQKIYQLAEGRVYTGADALKLGLVDRLGGLREALQGAKELAQLDPKKLYPVSHYEPPVQGLLDCLTEGNPWHCLSSLKSDLGIQSLGSLKTPALWQPLRTLSRLLEHDHLLAYWPGYPSLEHPMHGLGED